MSSPRNKKESLMEPQSLKQCMQQGLKQMFQAQQLCDVTLVAEGRKFSCHRMLLASVSPYFLRLFTASLPEAQNKEIVLQDMASATLQSVLNYLYTEELILTAENAPNLFTAACRLQILPLEERAGRFVVDYVSLENCLGLYALARSHNHPAVLQAALRCVSQNFEPLSGCKEFLSLDHNALISLLSLDNLAVISELVVYRAVKRWVDSVPTERLPLLRELLGNVRFPLLSRQELAEVQADLAKRYRHVQLQWKKLDGKGRMQASGGLRQGMYQEGIVYLGLLLFHYLGDDDYDSEDDDDEVDVIDSPVHFFDPCAESWHRLADLKGLWHSSCVSVGHKLYVSGGLGTGEHVVNTLYEYDSSTNRWLKLPSMAVPRHKHAFLAWKQKLYAVAGGPTDGRSAESFDLVGKTWAAIASPPFGVRDFASAVLKGKLYIIGGWMVGVSPAAVLKGSLIYDIASDVWTEVPQDLVFFQASAVALDNRICVMGGFGRSETGEECDTTNKCFFLGEDGMLSHNGPLPHLVKRVTSPGALRWQDRVYVLGGNGDDGNIVTVDYWKPGQSNWTRVKGGLPDPDYGAFWPCCAILEVPKAPLLCLLHETSVSSVAVGVTDN
uniref:BTB domain-containing protein n=1 Tax=Sphenodon punctatus TaxID=8508 RepID=A0A8D0H4S0_SPHPU